MQQFYFLKDQCWVFTNNFASKSSAGADCFLSRIVPESKNCIHMVHEYQMYKSISSESIYVVVVSRRGLASHANTKYQRY